jgi:hypothetical protein
MAIAIITRWLESGREYRSGVELYLQYGSSEFLKKMFTTSETRFNRSKLVQCLEEINSSKKIVEIEQTRKPVFSSQWLSDKEYAGLPAEVKALKQKKGILYKEMSDLHSQLDHLSETDQKKCGEAAFRILDIDDELKSIWAKLDYYEEHRRLPDEEPVPPSVDQMTREQLQLRKNTLRTYLTKGYTKHRPEYEAILKRLENA